MLNLKHLLTQLAYRALNHTPTRPLPSPAIITADQELAGSKRKLSWALARDLEQNFVIAGWMVDQHLTYTSSFNFQARTPDMEFNKALEMYCLERFGKKRIDIAGRMSLDDMARAFMASKLWDGDAAIIKTSQGMLQLLEAWQIAKVDGAPDGVNENGLVLDPYGRVKQYAVAIRDSQGIHHAAMIDADNMIFDGYFRKANQTRGVSPLMPVINSARDVMDATAYYLLKTKIAAMFGIVIYRDHGKKSGNDFEMERPSGDGAEKKPLQYNIQPGLKLELEQNDKAEFLESHTPPGEFLNFATFLIRQILSALKIPYSMYDSGAANYSASRSDLNRYKSSTENERKQMLAVYDEITDFILRHDIRTGALKLPRGMTYDQIEWEWLPTASFVIDRPAEVATYISLLDRGLTTRANICKELGLGNFYHNAAALGQEERYLKEQNVTVALANPGAPVSQDKKSDDDLTSQQNKKE
nr:MAG TPA: portal protein, lambda family [Caudoviricetes sp.]